MPDEPLDPAVRERVTALLVAGGRLNRNYLALSIASCAIATLGLLENSAAVIIGAMIVAPLMLPIQAIAFGALDGSAQTLRRGVVTLATGVAASVVLSALLAKSLGLSDFGAEILSRTRPNLLDLGIALTAGAIGAFASVRPSIANSLAGTAIAVALMPPLCVVGIGLANGRVDLSRGAALLFVTNLLGIAFASMVVFLLAGHAKRPAFSALGWTGALVALLVAPLAFSFENLVRQAALQNGLRLALTTKTATFRQATLVSSEFDWLSQPPTATLFVRSSAPFSPHQVALLEAFAERATGQRFQLVIESAQYERVTSAGGPPASGSSPSAVAPSSARHD